MMSHISYAPKAADTLDLGQAMAELCRPTLSVLAALAASLTVYVLNPLTPWHRYLLTAIVLFCVTAAAFAINDYDDIEKDRINHPERPLPSGRLRPQQARWIAILLFAVALLTALPLGLNVWLLVAGSTILLWNYSAILQVNGILGNGVVATIVAALLLLGALVAAKPLAVIYPASLLFGYALAKEITWDIHDAVGDRLRGVHTIANQWGPEQAFQIVWSLLILLFLSIPVALYYLPMTVPLLFGCCAAGLLLSFAVALRRYECDRTPSNYRGLMIWGRIGMIFGLVSLLGI